jgi:hypothetical protein
MCVERMTRAVVRKPQLETLPREVQARLVPNCASTRAPAASVRQRASSRRRMRPPAGLNAVKNPSPII